MTGKVSEINDSGVFVLPGFGKYFRMFVAIIAALGAVGCVIEGGAIAIFRMTLGVNIVFGIFVAIFFLATGLFTIYVSFVNKGTRIIGTD